VRSPLFKKLDILIVKAFIGPFIATFFITVFVLVLQFFWLYIDDVVGKGVDVFTVMRLVLYLATTLVPLALPLAVLLSSIMTLGNLGETFELIAIKSAGISLLRFMRPLFFVSLLLTIIAFFFNTSVLPVATLKLNNLKSDIILTRPAFDIREGVFYDKLTGFVIKIGKKDKNDSTIHDVVIYEQEGTSPQDNVIVADSGKMVISPDKQHLVFTLRHGTRYQAKPDGGFYNSQLVRMSFDTYKKVMDLSVFNMMKTDENQYRNNYQHQTLPQLSRAIDSIRKINENYIDHSTKMIDANLKFSNWLDSSGWDKVENDTTHSRFLLPMAYVTDSIHRVWAKAHHDRDSIDKAQAALQARAKVIADSTRKAAAGAHPPSKPDTLAVAHHPVAPAPATALHPTATNLHPGATAATHPHPDTNKLASHKHSSATAAIHPHPDTPKSLAHHPAVATTQPGVAVNHSGAPATTHPDAHDAPRTATHAAPAAPQPKPVIPVPGGIAVNRLTTMLKPPPVSFEDLLPDSVRQNVMEKANTAINNAKVSVDQPISLYENEVTNLHEHQIAWHEKLTYAVAVLVMFLIGAPLGSIIRKGGIGLPLVFAVIFFVIFFLLNNFGRKFTKEGVMSAIGGMWMATYVLTPIGIFLTYKAMHDSQLFNKEFYFRLSRSVKAFFKRLRDRDKANAS
jgi:lipopolysaccharide export system permease protein